MVTSSRETARSADELEQLRQQEQRAVHDAESHIQALKAATSDNTEDELMKELVRARACSSLRAGPLY
jgi:hypothetical protein